MLTNSYMISSDSSVFNLIIVIKCQDNENQFKVTRIVQRSNIICDLNAAHMLQFVRIFYLQPWKQVISTIAMWKSINQDNLYQTRQRLFHILSKN